MTTADETTTAEGTGGLGAGGVRRPRRPLPQWYRHRPAASLEIDCGGARHTIRWARGRLVLLDHDVAAETALMALGAERPACLTLYDRWRACFVHRVGNPGPAIVAGRAPARGGGAGTLRSALAASGDPRAFGAELGAVVELARLVQAERRWADPQLPAGDRQRLVDAFRAALVTAFDVALPASAGPRGRTRRELRAKPLPSGEQAAVEVAISPGRVEVDLQLPLGWAVDVAGRGLGRCPGRMVLAIVDRDPLTAALGVTGIVWGDDGAGRVDARVERWWTARVGDEWSVVEGARAVGGGDGVWCSISRR